MSIGNFFRPTMIALAVVAGAGALAACGSDRGYESNVATRCNESGDHCWQVRCNDEGGDCYPVNYSYGPRGNYDTGHRYWVCDENRDNCHWADSDPSQHDQ